MKVKFSGFEASHGPIKAYAIILTTGAGKEGPLIVTQPGQTVVLRLGTLPCLLWPLRFQDRALCARHPALILTSYSRAFHT